MEGIETSNPRYNWTRLDSALDVLVSSLNSFSSEFDKFYQAQTKTNETFFTNFEEKEKVYAWKRLIKDLALHLTERYGAAEIASMMPVLKALKR